MSPSALDPAICIPITERLRISSVQDVRYPISTSLYYKLGENKIGRWNGTVLVVVIKVRNLISDSDWTRKNAPSLVDQSLSSSVETSFTRPATKL